MQLTDWSLISQAGATDSSESREALERLCRDYWNPIYAHIRASGFSPHDAEDLAQSFMAELLSKRALAKADPALGRFRSFLLGALKYFIASHLRKNRTQKRGGGNETISCDDPENPEVERNLSTTETPETAFLHKWVTTLMERALQPLRAEYAAKGRATDFAVIEPSILRDENDQSCAELAARLRKTTGAMKVEICRLRKEYARLFQEEVARTVSTRAEVEEEIRFMFGVFRK